jgi:SAM-dependent methyltransferase
LFDPIHFARRVKRKLFPITPIREKEIPPQEINFNSGGGNGYVEYARLYKEKAVIVDIPFLIEKAGLSPQSAILDYGCGMGRFTYAAGKYLSNEGRYYGYEPNQTAIAFLKQAYADRPNFHFDGRPLNFEEDYVAGVYGTKVANTIGALDVDLSFVERPVDIQWTASVFTHMWVEPIISVLRKMAQVVKPNGIYVNSWFIIDDNAKFALRCGLTDRSLPFVINRAWTYSQTNPLVCTGYEEETVKEIYASAGHDIIAIIKGHWTGRESRQEQDMVISQLRA